jgi:hypothetical protein
MPASEEGSQHLVAFVISSCPPCVDELEKKGHSRVACNPKNIRCAIPRVRATGDKWSAGPYRSVRTHPRVGRLHKPCRWRLLAS